MMPAHRYALPLAAAAVALPFVSAIATAQNYPSRPVRIVVGFAPGGGQDILARLIGQGLSELLGQSFIVDNRPGAGTNTATEAVVNAQPDGYTLLFFGPPAAINATLYDKLRFNFVSDIAPIASVTRVPFVMVVNPSFPAKNLDEFITHAKANPSKFSMASSGIGSGPQMAANCSN
jgi:tripartite-type tricarboxylate transporter receptor subunit TctC